MAPQLEVSFLILGLQLITLTLLQRCDLYKFIYSIVLLLSIFEASSYANTVVNFQTKEERTVQYGMPTIIYNQYWIGENVKIRLRGYIPMIESDNYRCIVKTTLEKIIDNINIFNIESPCHSFDFIRLRRIPRTLDIVESDDFSNYKLNGVTISGTYYNYDYHDGYYNHGYKSGEIGYLALEKSLAFNDKTFTITYTSSDEKTTYSEEFSLQELNNEAANKIKKSIEIVDQENEKYKIPFLTYLSKVVIIDIVLFVAVYVIYLFIKRRLHPSLLPPFKKIFLTKKQRSMATKTSADQSDAYLSGEIKKLYELHNKGVLSKEEYEAAKKKTLGIEDIN